jgi:hypothetical protein
MNDPNPTMLGLLQEIIDQLKLMNIKIEELKKAK